MSCGLKGANYELNYSGVESEALKEILNEDKSLVLEGMKRLGNHFRLFYDEDKIPCWVVIQANGDKVVTGNTAMEAVDKMFHLLEITP